MQVKVPAFARLYVHANAIGMGMYTLVVLHWGLLRFTTFEDPIPWFIRVVTILACGGLAWQMWTLLRAVHDSDEFMRAVMGKRLLTAAFITLASATIWALLHNIGWAPAVPALFLLLAFFIIHALIIPLINADQP